MGRSLGLTILISIILSILIISIVNVGTELVHERPDYKDFCGDVKPIQLEKGQDITQEFCEENGGKWTAEDIRCITTPCPQGYCDYYFNCQEELNLAEQDYNQLRFYIFAIIGFALLLLGLIHKELMIQITGLATGGILVLEGVVMNLQNKLVVFIALLLILAVFGVLGYRLVRKK